MTSLCFVSQTKEKYGKECKVCLNTAIHGTLHHRKVFHFHTFFSTDLRSAIYGFPVVSRVTYAFQEDGGLSDLQQN